MAKWIQQESPNGGHFNCSECGHEVCVPCSEMIDPRDYVCYLDDYCGNCGARIDGALTMAEKEIPVGADLNDFPGIGVYKQDSGLAEAFQKAMKESPHVLVIPEKPRWIPCSDRLPEPLQNVLVCDINTVTIAWINGDGWYLADTGNGHIEWVELSEITYWMPLPEPPESEAQNEST